MKRRYHGLISIGAIIFGFFCSAYAYSILMPLGEVLFVSGVGIMFIGGFMLLILFIRIILNK